jgi:hypothetical protein
LGVVGGTSPTSEFTPAASNGAGGSSVPFKNVSYHSANNNGLVDGAQSPVLITTQPKSSTSQRDDLYFSDTDKQMPPKKVRFSFLFSRKRVESRIIFYSLKLLNMLIGCAFFLIG